jgi:hypothetical protein
MRGSINMENKNNDQRIIELKKQIDEKKLKIVKSKRFIPITNCILTLKEKATNLNVLNKSELIEHLIILNSYRKSAEELNLLENFEYNGYHVNDWIDDIKNKLDVLNRKEEESKLKLMESKLDKLLSDDKKTELELDSIESLLK